MSERVAPRAVHIPGKKHLMLFSGRANMELAEEVAQSLGIDCGEVDLADFPSGEIYTRFDESVRGTDAFVIQSHFAPLNDRIMEQLLMIDALKRASAKRISAVIPFYGYSRGDKKGRSREPIAAKLMADMFKAAGANRIISMDLHSGQIQGFFDGPVDHLTALPPLSQYLADNYSGDIVIVSPDTGRVKSAEKFSAVLGYPIAIVHKQRNPGHQGEVEVREVVGDVDGKHCVIVDDMIDTGGTIVQGAEALMRRGASRVTAAATHGVFSDPAIDRLKNSVIEEVVVTNTLPLPPEKRIDKITVLSVAHIFADAIRAVFEDASVSELFRGQNQA